MNLPLIYGLGLICFFSGVIVLILARAVTPKLVGYEQREGWKRPLPVYRGKCSKHGYFTNYLQGHDERLECPKCQKER